MAKAIVARMEGDDYQARFFWIQACRLFQQHTKVQRVSYEVKNPKSFDDVVVSYEPSINDNRGGFVWTDYFQVKYHVSQNGSVGWESLMTPEFIGASTFSFLQRLRDAYSKTNGGGGRRFILVTPWAIMQDDPLAELVNNNAGQLHLEKLYSGGPRSRWGRLRKRTAEHLGIDEDSMMEILGSVRIQHSFGSLADLNSLLGNCLQLAGMKPIQLTSSSSIYDDLIKKLLGE